MRGKVAVVTGANTGIGLETARALAQQGMTTVLACRNATKAQRARDDIAASTGSDDVHVVALDLSDLDSVRPFQITPARGARTSIHCASSPDAAGRSGLYWVTSKPADMSRWAKDDAEVTRLWDVSTQLLADAGYATASS